MMTILKRFQVFVLVLAILIIKSVYCYISSAPSFHIKRAACFVAFDLDSSAFPVSELGERRGSILSAFSVSSIVLLATLGTSPLRARAALGINKLGVDEQTGLLEVCPSNGYFPSCVSSQDDRPAVFLAPWCYDGPYTNLKLRLLDFISTRFPTASNRLISDNDRYLRFEFIDASAHTVDDTEFYITPDDNTVQCK